MNGRLVRLALSVALLLAATHATEPSSPGCVLDGDDQPIAWLGTCIASYGTPGNYYKCNDSVVTAAEYSDASCSEVFDGLYIPPSWRCSSSATATACDGMPTGPTSEPTWIPTPEPSPMPVTSAQCNAIYENGVPIFPLDVCLTVVEAEPYEGEVVDFKYSCDTSTYSVAYDCSYGGLQPFEGSTSSFSCVSDGV